MKSTLKDMMARHRQEIDDLRSNCKHKSLVVWEDRSHIGCGSAYPSAHIMCADCGTKKIMFRRSAKEMAVKVQKTLKKQAGIVDQRLDCYIIYEWELDKT